MRHARASLLDVDLRSVRYKFSPACFLSFLSWSQYSTLSLNSQIYYPHCACDNKASVILSTFHSTQSAVPEGHESGLWLVEILLSAAKTNPRVQIIQSQLKLCEENN